MLHACVRALMCVRALSVPVFFIFFFTIGWHAHCFKMNAMTTGVAGVLVALSAEAGLYVTGWVYTY